ncbi:DUF58 domain-containing protein [Niabella aurantiaca]|uniref:DUF58 domain-containing protein n=1 Tax=Niabella aurantiaca TaxID=379900 RepID=UPI00037F0255|nr:DUF58 domain-containing protein [Niabella aurantiaca]
MQSFYLNKIVYYTGGAIALLFIASYFHPALYTIAALLLALLSIAVLADALLVYGKSKGIIATRTTPDRLSIGDENRITLHLFNNYSYPVNLSVIDELPVQFQERNWVRKAALAGNQGTDLYYSVKPLTRGEYVFHNIHVFVTAPLRLVTRKFSIAAQKTTKVYPSYVQMRRFQLLAISNRLREAGVKRSPRLGHSMEFEHIKEYVRGDDYRTINWKATGRKGSIMVNNYTDERSQQVFCIVNKGRVMKMPFEGMTLLDYAINTSLVLSNISLVKQDKAGLITFAENQDSFIPADKRPGQMNLILETLYKQETRFLEADYEKLYTVTRNKINGRSLLVLFTNFESMESLQREMPALKKMAHYHLLLVVIFENTAIKGLIESRATNLEEVYVKTIAEKFAFEKRQMVKELQQNGILGILTTPQQLTVNTINKYLELKNRARI